MSEIRMRQQDTLCMLFQTRNKQSSTSKLGLPTTCWKSVQKHFCAKNCKSRNIDLFEQLNRKRSRQKLGYAKTYPVSPTAIPTNYNHKLTLSLAIRFRKNSLKNSGAGKSWKLSKVWARQQVTWRAYVTEACTLSARHTALPGQASEWTGKRSNTSAKKAFLYSMHQYAILSIDNTWSERQQERCTSHAAASFSL